MNENTYRFEEYIEYFNKIKENSLDIDKKIASEVINEPIKKMLFLIKNKKLEDWLLSNFHNFPREELYLTVCDMFLEGQLDVTDRTKQCEQAIRTILAISTEGVVSTPLEGISEVYIGKNSDNTEYLGIKYAGPIRAAGATAASLTVIIAIYISNKLGLVYKPTKQETERYAVECGQYVRIHPQIINPKDSQIYELVSRIPFCIDGVAAEPELVNVHRYIPRVNTPFLRGGAMLIFCVLIIKSKKVVNLASLMNLDMSYLNEVYKNSTFNEESGGSSFLNSIVAGRAVFSMPQLGGFRMRIGRSRNTGLGSQGISPLTMRILKFLNTGSQMMVSTPGKANSVVPVTDLDGPTVELINGAVVTVTKDNIELVESKIKHILDLGQLLIAYGEFIENKVPLKEVDHSLDYWRLKYSKEIPTGTSLVVTEYCIKHKYMLIPYLSPVTLTYPVDHWKLLRTYLINNYDILINKLKTPDKTLREYLNSTLLNYTVEDGFICFENPVVVCAYFLLDLKEYSEFESVYDILCKNTCPIIFPKKGALYIGTRLASVEAAGISKVGTGINLVYRVKSEKFKTLQKCVEQNKKQKVYAKPMQCPMCEDISVQRYCINCNVVTHPQEGPLIHGEHDVLHDLIMSSRRLGISPDTYPLVVTNELDRTDYWEPFEKGILRAKYGLITFKDGVIHFSASNLVLTQFKPAECNLTVEKAIKLGYTEDIFGNPLVSTNQILNLKIYDMILPLSFATTILAVTKYVDELLVKYYGVEPHHNCKTIQDLVGLNMASIAPHILNGMCGRLIGFMDQFAFYRHPLVVAACRRNADGDKDASAVLSDILLNYSSALLKNGNGRYMNVFAILSTELYVDSIDKEVTNMDIEHAYSLKMYESRNLIEDRVEVKKVANIKPHEEPTTYYGFTTPTDTIIMPNAYNSYKNLATLEEKIDQQIELAKRIFNVDVSLVLSKVIEGHLIKDILGNVRQFMRQNVRCTKCNILYEILPLDGNCRKCKQILNYTVHPKSAIKYIGILTKYLEMYRHYLSTYMISAILQTIREAKEIIRPVEQTSSTGFKKFIR